MATASNRQEYDHVPSQQGGQPISTGPLGPHLNTSQMDLERRSQTTTKLTLSMSENRTQSLIMERSNCVYNS